MAASLQYVSVGCNQTPHNVDWSSEGLLAYGAGNSVALARKGEVSTYTSNDDIHNLLIILVMKSYH